MIFDIRKWKYFEVAKQRFLSKVDKTDTCWLWTGGKYTQGYGCFHIGGQQYRAHRVSYMLFKGPIPFDKIVRHTCDVELCVNPEHLILGNSIDNSEDMVKRCRQGKQKLNSEAVKVIKWYLKYRPSYGLAVKLARLHKVIPRTISNIKTGKAWHWIKV